MSIYAAVWFGQVLDGLVLVLAIILNPRAKRAAQHGGSGEQKPHVGVDTVTAIVPVSTSATGVEATRDPIGDHLTPTPMTVCPAH